MTVVCSILLILQAILAGLDKLGLTVDDVVAYVQNNGKLSPAVDDVLQYHVVPSFLTSATLQTLTSVTTVSGKVLPISTDSLG